MGPQTRSNPSVVTLSVEQLEFLAEQVSKKIDAKLEAREKFVDKRLEELQDENDQLKEKTDDLEQRNRLENLRIFGVSEKKDEHTDQLVMEVASEQGIFLERKSISRSHRVGKKIDGKHRAIIVKFVSYADRQKMFLAKKELKGTGITIREDLTRLRQEILRKASEYYDNVWIQNGVIVIKDGNRFHRVHTMKKLNNIINESK